MELPLEEIDLAALAGMLRARYGHRVEASYLRGRTLLRDALMDELRCSASRAEELVETLELQGYVRFPQLPDDTHPGGRAGWIIGR